MVREGNTRMSDITQPRKPALMRNLPVIGILLVAVIGFFTLRDYLSFQTLADNREALIAFRDDNYLLTALALIAVYVLVVAFSLPGASIATLTSGFLFGPVFGAIFSVLSATIGATIIFLAARHGFGETLGARMDASKGTIKKIKDGIDENQWSMLFVIRLVPVVPFFVANLVPAFMQVPLHRYSFRPSLGSCPVRLSIHPWALAWVRSLPGVKRPTSALSLSHMCSCPSSGWLHSRSCPWWSRR